LAEAVGLRAFSHFKHNAGRHCFAGFHPASNGPTMMRNPMGELFTVDVEAADEKLIPASKEQLENDLHDRLKKVYVYVGQRSDSGWSIALTVAGLLPDLQPYLATNIDILRDWVPNGNPRGVVFGTDDKPDRVLNEQEATDRKTVHKANAEAV
jgi:hypothetical protein